MYKKALSPILTGILFLMVAVFGTIATLNWLDDFSERISTTYFPEGSIQVEALAGDYLYVRNFNNENFTYEGLTIDGSNCSLSGQLGSNRLNQINISGCASVASTTPKEIVFFGDSWIYSEEKIHRGAVVNVSTS